MHYSSELYKEEDKGIEHSKLTECKQLGHCTSDHK